MISYAQNFEDVILWRVLKHVNSGFYIDVGANDPKKDSVTKWFYDNGWRGINIEPVSQWFHEINIDRVRDINLNVAAGDSEGTLTLYEIPDTGLSTSNKEYAEKHENENGFANNEIQVPQKTLTSICEEFHVSPIHFLKIDVEGAELSVLNGLDLKIIRPWIILVEATLPGTQKEEYQLWENILLSGGYHFTYFDGLNRFYVADEKVSELKSLFSAPPNIFDGFTHINSVELENKNVESTNELKSLSKKLDSAHVELENSQTQLLNNKTEIENLKGKLSSQLNDLDSCESELHNTKETLEASEAQVTESKELSDKLRNNLSLAKMELNKVQIEFDTAQQDFIAIKENALHSQKLADEFKEKADTALLELSELSKEKLSLQKKNSTLESVLTEKERLFSSVERERTLLHEECYSLSLSLQDSSKALDKIAQELQDSKMEYCKQQQLFIDVSEALNDGKQKLSGLNAELISARDELEEVRNDLELSTKDNIQLQTEVSCLNETLASETLHKENARNETLRLQSDLEIIASKVNELESALNHEKMNSNALDNLVKNLRLQNTALKSSWSWRITFPIRLLIDCSRLLLKFVFSIIKWPFIWPLKFMMKKVLRNKHFSARINLYLIKKLPRLHRHLRQFAIHRGLILTSTEIHQVPAQSEFVPRENSQLTEPAKEPNEGDLIDEVKESITKTENNAGIVSEQNIYVPIEDEAKIATLTPQAYRVYMNLAVKIALNKE